MMQSIEKATIPNDYEAEQAVLGSVLYNNSTLLDVINIIKPSSFYTPAHQHIFRSMVELYDKGKPYDEILLGHELKSLNQLEEVGGYSYLSTLQDCVPGSGNTKHYAEIIKEHSLLRMVISVTTDIARKSRDPESNAIDLIAELNQKIEKVNQFNDDDTGHIKDIFAETFQELEDISDGTNKKKSILTGFADIDRMTGGQQKPSFDIIGARPSMGKTALALNILRYGINEEGYDLFFSLETSKSKLAIRLLSQAGRVDSIKLKTRSLDSDDWDKLSMAVDILSAGKILINDSTTELNKIVAIIRQKHKQHGLKRVWIDYLQLVGGNKLKPREQEIAEISRTLKLLSIELGINITALCQLNRALEQRANKRPMMSDLRESGSIEQDADIIMFIYRDEVYNEDTPEPGIAEVEIAKNKDGPIGNTKLVFIGKNTLFANHSDRCQDE